MITKRERNLSQLMVAVQAAISVVLFYLVDLFLPHMGVVSYEKWFFMSQIAIIWTFLFTKFRLGIIFRASSFGSMIQGYLVTISIGGVLLFLELELMRLLAGHFSYYLNNIIIFCVVDLVVLIGFKYFFYHLMRYLRSKGHNSRGLIIIADEHCVPFIDTFIKAKDWGYRLKAIISPDKKLQQHYAQTQVITDSESIKNMITNKTVEDIFYCLPVIDTRINLEQLIKDTEEIGVNLHIMQQSSLDNMNQKNKTIRKFDNSFVTYQTTPTKYISLKIKEASDILFSAVVMVALFPLFALLAALVKLQDGGPIFFKQERIGLNGRRFVCYKFRSMVVNAEKMIDELQDKNESDGPTFKIKDDPRITKLGKILRKTSLDELPQFYNVIKGEMSVVGPRPPLLSEVKQYERSQLRRLSMKPGITCIWQVWGRNEVSFEEWMKMDLEYIDNWSIWLDLKIMLATVTVVLKANGQ